MPVLFPPYEWPDGTKYFDGGVWADSNLDYAIQQCMQMLETEGVNEDEEELYRKITLDVLMPIAISQVNKIKDSSSTLSNYLRAQDITKTFGA